MKLAKATHIPDGLLAAMTRLSEKPRLGVPTAAPASHPAFWPTQTTTALGDSRSVARQTRWTHQMGRWMSPDPYDGSMNLGNPQSLNRYNYVGNNPLRYTDPSGLFPCVPAPVADPATTISVCVGTTLGEFICGPACSAVIGGVLGLATLAAEDIFGGFFAHPTFHGSLKPRPNASNVSCKTKLPNGNTVGQYINQGRAQLQAVVDNQNALAAAGGDVNPFAVQSSFASFVRDYGPIDFKNGAAGVGGNGAILGQAGNFAYYAIGSGYLPTYQLNAGAGLYGIASALRGNKPFSSLTGPMFSDASANSVREAGLATPGCPN